MIDPDIAAHYELGFEAGRLFVDGSPRVELVRTLELLDRLLPAGGRVLDVGGGTGVYARLLCERGHDVHLVDPVERHVVEALATAPATPTTAAGPTGPPSPTARPLARGAAAGPGTLTASIGDARDLVPFGSGFDAVLLLGPLYHLPDAADRARAWQQAVAAVRPGGVVVAVGISRFASLLDGLRRQILGEPAFRAIVEGDLRDGRHRNPDVAGHPEWFTTAYFHHPDELEAEAVAAGLHDVGVFAVEGPGWILEDRTTLEDQLVAARAVETERTLLGLSSHLLVAGTAPDPAAPVP